MEAGACERASLALSERLRARSRDIEETILARARSVEDPSVVEDPEYARGLRGAVRVAVEHSIAVLGGEMPLSSDALPTELTAQARLAARNAVALDTVLLRYLAGHTVLCDFLLAEGEASPVELRQALRAQAALLERVLAAVADAYRRETRERHLSADRRRTDLVKRLLAGEPQDTSEFRYGLELWHLGVLATGPGAAQALRELAAALDRRFLIVRPGGEEVWAWLGGHQRLAVDEVAELARATLASEATVALGEPGRGISGWRLTHRQARAAMPVALGGSDRVVAYADVSLLAAAMADEVLSGSLIESYLVPLSAQRDGGVALRETLRAYFAAGRSVTSAAAALAVSRQTVNARLHIVEERIGRPLNACASELETALRLLDLSNHRPSRTPYIRQAD